VPTGTAATAPDLAALVTGRRSIQAANTQSIANTYDLAPGRDPYARLGEKRRPSRERSS
jgi:hypothetical protein